MQRRPCSFHQKALPYPKHASYDTAAALVELILLELEETLAELEEELLLEDELAVLEEELLLLEDELAVFEEELLGEGGLALQLAGPRPAGTQSSLAPQQTEGSPLQRCFVPEHDCGSQKGIPKFSFPTSSAPQHTDFFLSLVVNFVVPGGHVFSGGRTQVGTLIQIPRTQDSTVLSHLYGA